MHIANDDCAGGNCAILVDGWRVLSICVSNSYLLINPAMGPN